MVWLFPAGADMTELGLEAAQPRARKVVRQNLGAALLVGFELDRSAGLLHCSFRILGGYEDPAFSHELICKTASLKEGVHDMQTSALSDSVS